MTVYAADKLPLWVTKVQEIADRIVSQAVNDMLADIKVVPGLNRGAPQRYDGTIPRDIGALASSLRSTIYGGTALNGATSWMLVAGGMNTGDVATFSWGGSAAPYAKHVHYGSNGVKGTFWVDIAAAGWSGYVKGAVEKARIAIQ